MEFQLQVGNKLFPKYPMRSVQECFYQLRKCMGVESSNFHSLDISLVEYKTQKFIVAFDIEKALGASFTGLNIKIGSLMTLKRKLADATTAGAGTPDAINLVLHFESILNIKDNGIEVFG